MQSSAIMLAFNCKCNYHANYDGTMAKKTSKTTESAWPVLIAAHRRILDRMEADLAAAGMPELTWYDVLWTLERAPSRRLRLHELAHDIVLSRSNITRLMDRLQGAGLIRRERSEEDRRGYFAVITARGLAMRRRMWPVYARAIESHFDQHLTASEHTALRTIFRRLLEPLRNEDDMGSG